MRNLKRALSLALACIMLLGMMVTGAGAASTSFTDFDKIVNQEAAEVTSGLGIFDGYTDGSFGPENVVTRAEMAVIICKLLNGSDVDPGNFTGVSKFNDVPSWAEGYVNYCASMGIVVGVGEGKFNPSATVSTVEAATMLLKALGYFTDEDKLSEDWKTVVTGRATTLKLYGDLVLSVDEGLTRDNVAELVFNTLFAQRVAYDDNRHLYVKNTNRDVVVTNGTNDPLNTFAMNTFDMWYIDGIVTANSYTDDSLSETTNNAPRTEVLFNAQQDWPYMGGSSVTHYPFEYTTGLDMIAHAARVYYSIDRNAPVVYAIADRAEKVAYISYNSNSTRLADAANEAGFRRNTINQISSDDYLVNYDWDTTVKDLRAVTNNEVNLSGPDINKTLILISNSTDNTVDYVIVLDQYLDTVKRVAEKNGVTEYDLTTMDGDDQNIAHDSFTEGDYVIVTDIGKQGDMFNLTAPEKVSASITKITGVSDQDGTVKSIIADGTTYTGSPVADHRNNRRTDVGDALDNTTNFERITTLGETTLLLDFQGKCIGLAEPETVNDYAYAAQFGVRHITNSGLNTKFQLTVELYFQDGTSGVYVVNTEDNLNVNSYPKSAGWTYTRESDAEVAARLLNGEGTAANPETYHPWKVYTSDANSGLGVYRVILRGDGTAVLCKLADDVVNNVDAGTRLVQSHSTIVLNNGSNLLDNSSPAVPVYQTNKTVYFYVSGRYDNDTLSVGARTGIANAKGFTHDMTVGGTGAGGKDTDENGEYDSFVQILCNGTSSTGVYANRKTVQAVMVWGIDLGGDTNLYFYKEGSYHIEHKDSVSSKAVENDRVITYDLYNADGEMVSKTYDNDGKYFDSVTASGEVSNKPTGWYKIGSKTIEPEYVLNNRSDVDVVKYNPKSILTAPNANIKNVYVLNAETYHDEFQENIYTTVDSVGGIILSNAKVIDTVDCGLDSVNDIARACAAGHRVRISYTYKTTGSGSYEVKTIFITDYKPDEGIKVNTGSGKNLVVNYNGDGYLYIYVRNDYEPTPSVVAEAVKTELERYGMTDVNATVETDVNTGRITWKVTGKYNGVTYTFNGNSTLVRKTAEIVVNNKVSYLYVNGNSMTAARLGLSANTTYALRFNNTEANSTTNLIAYVKVGTANNAANYPITVYDTDGNLLDADGVTYLTNLIGEGDVAIFTTTSNFKPNEAIPGLTGNVDDALTGVSATFDGKAEGEEFSAAVGTTINVIINGSGSRAVGDTATTFTVGSYYNVTINGVEKKVQCTVANQLTVPYTIQASDAAGLVIKVTAITEAEADPAETGKITVSVTSGYTLNTTEITEAGPATITVTGVPSGDAADAKYNMTVTGVVSKTVNNVGKEGLTFDVDITEDVLATGGTINVAIAKVADEEEPNEPTKVPETGSLNDARTTYTVYYTADDGNGSPVVPTEAKVKELLAEEFGVTVDKVEISWNGGAANVGAGNNAVVTTGEMTEFETGKTTVALNFTGVYSMTDGASGKVIGYFETASEDVDITGYLTGYKFAVKGATDAIAFASTSQITFDPTEKTAQAGAAQNVTIWGAYMLDFEFGGVTVMGADKNDGSGTRFDVTIAGAGHIFITQDTKVSVASYLGTDTKALQFTGDGETVRGEARLSDGTNVPATVADVKVSYAGASKNAINVKDVSVYKVTVRGKTLEKEYYAQGDVLLTNGTEKYIAIKTGQAMVFDGDTSLFKYETTAPADPFNPGNSGASELKLSATMAAKAEDGRILLVPAVVAKAENDIKVTASYTLVNTADGTTSTISDTSGVTDDGTKTLYVPLGAKVKAEDAAGSARAIVISVSLGDSANKTPVALGEDTSAENYAAPGVASTTAAETVYTVSGTQQVNFTADAFVAITLPDGVSATWSGQTTPQTGSVKIPASAAANVTLTSTSFGTDHYTKIGSDYVKPASGNSITGVDLSSNPSVTPADKYYKLTVVENAAKGNMTDAELNGATITVSVTTPSGAGDKFVKATDSIVLTLTTGTAALGTNGENPNDGFAATAAQNGVTLGAQTMSGTTKVFSDSDSSGTTGTITTTLTSVDPDTIVNGVIELTVTMSTVGRS